MSNEIKPTFSLCEQQISMGAYRTTERVRVPFGKSRTVFIYECPKCKNERRMRANSYRGQAPVAGVGAFVCGAYLPHAAEVKTNG